MALGTLQNLVYNFRGFASDVFMFVFAQVRGGPVELL